MTIPNLAAALVPEAKVVRYLLSSSHSAGRAKAAFFRQFGFQAEEWKVLAEALRRHAQENEVVKTEAAPFGTRYVVEGPLRTPSGRSPSLRAVWFVEEGEDVPRFVTAYPLTYPKKAG